MGWDVALFSGVTLNAVSIAFYGLEKLFAQGTVPPEVYYYWNYANYWNAKYGTKVIGGIMVFSNWGDDLSMFDLMRVGAWGGQQYGSWYLGNRLWPAMKQEMRDRLDDVMDDGMYDEDWVAENGELMLPGPGL